MCWLMLSPLCGDYRIDRRQILRVGMARSGRGIVGSGVVFSWAYTLMRDTSGILLDRTPSSSDLLIKFAKQWRAMAIRL